MNAKLTLGLLLLMAGGLIYAGTHHQQERLSEPQARHEPGRRLSHLHGRAPPLPGTVRGWAAAGTSQPDTTGSADDGLHEARIMAARKDSVRAGRTGGWGLCGSN